MLQPEHFPSLKASQMSNGNDEFVDFSTPKKSMSSPRDPMQFLSRFYLGYATQNEQVLRFGCSIGCIPSWANNKTRLVSLKRLKLLNPITISTKQCLISTRGFHCYQDINDKLTQQESQF